MTRFSEIAAVPEPTRVTLTGADGSVIDSTLRKRFESTLDCFLDFVEASRHYPAMKIQWVEFLGERPNVATERVELSSAEAA